MYICIDLDGNSSIGDTPDAAHQIYNNNFGEYSFEDLKFYKSEQIQVEIIEKPIVEKTKTVTKASK